MALTRTPQTDSKTKLGRYELLRELAASSVGTSWLARPTGETFEVTLFKVHRHMAKAQTAVEGLLSEAQGARKFAHDNVAGVLDAGVVDGEPFIVNEYVGESLSSLLRAAGPNGLPIPIALRISLDILEGFAAAHTHDPQIGHGELGPWCVYVGSDGVARVGGFGVDQAVWRFGAHYVKNMERLSYAAPERVKSMSSTLAQELAVADEQSDLFSTAVLVFELLTRQKLFASKMEAAVVQKVLSSPIPTAQSFRPEIPLEVSDALKQALVRDRSERLDNFEDFIVALEGAGPELIASNEAVAEMVALAANEKGAQEKRSIPPPPGFVANGATPSTARDPGTGEILSSAGTPGAATKRAPVPGRATLMFDEVKDLGFPPKVPAPTSGAPLPAVAAVTPKPAAAVTVAAVTAAAVTAAAVPAAAVPAAAVPAAAVPAAAVPAAAVPAAAVPAAAVPAKPANGTGALRPRAKTLMGFGAMRLGAIKESPPAPVVTEAVSPAPVAPRAPLSSNGNPRSSSIELDDADFDVELDDPLSLPTTVVELPASNGALATNTISTTTAKPAAAGASPSTGAVAQRSVQNNAQSSVQSSVQSTTAMPSPTEVGAVAASAKPAVKAPVRRTATLLGIQAPEMLAALAKNAAAKSAEIQDEPTTNIEDAATSLEAPSAELVAAVTPGLAIGATSDAEKSNVIAAKIEALRAKEPEGTPHSLTGPSPGSASSPGRRGLFTNEMLRTGAVLGVTGKAFELIAPVARGGMATVWAAREVGSKGLEKMVAIKTMLPELSDDADFESMFLDEARVAAKIRHLNVASIIDLGQEDSLLYLAMEWVDGETVGTIQRSARTSGGVPTPITVRIAADICAGLHEAHELSDDAGHFLEVVHRDISPANVLVARDGNAKIVDFGIAKSKGRLHVTKVGAMVKGKTPYLSPEQIGGLAIDRRSDLFSLGALLYVMATGLHPFRGETELSTIENIAIKAPVPIRNIVPDIDPAFEQIVLKLLEKDPKKRFQTAREVKDALEHLSGVAAAATTADVAAFVEKVVGDKLDQRRQMLHGGLERMERKQEGAVAATTSTGVPEATAASALQQVLERVRQTEPDVLSAVSFADPVPSRAQPGRVAATSSAAPLGGLDLGAPSSTTSAVANDGPLSGEGVSGVSASGVSANAPEFAEEPIDVPPQSNTKRLVALIAVGLLIGLAIVGGLEAFRSGPTTAPSATGSAPTKSAPTPTAPPTSQPTAAATPTNEPTAAPTSTTSTGEVSPPETATPKGPDTAAPKTPGKPTPWKPPTGPAHPPGSGKLPKPPKYNPPTI